MTQTEEVTELVTLIEEITDVQMVTELTKRKADEEFVKERTVVETEVGTNLGVRPTVEGEVLRPGVVIDDPSLVEEILGENGAGGERGDENDEQGAIVVDMVLDRDALDVLVNKENGEEADCGTKVGSSFCSLQKRFRSQYRVTSVFVTTECIMVGVKLETPSN